jgi:hypothetical protein
MCRVMNQNFPKKNQLKILITIFQNSQNFIQVNLEFKKKLNLFAF